MEKEKLSSRGAALIAQGRREAAAQKGGNPPPAAAAEEKPKASPAERLAQLMAEERAETARRKKKMRRYGLIGSARSEEHTSELQSPCNLVCRLLLEKKKLLDVRVKYHVNGTVCGIHRAGCPPGRASRTAILLLPLRVPRHHSHDDLQSA